MATTKGRGTGGGAKKGAGAKRSPRPKAQGGATDAAVDPAVRATIASARAAAERVVDERRRQLRRSARASVRTAGAPQIRGEAAATGAALDALDPALRNVFGVRRSAGVLIAEGDSWFDYPGRDVLKELEKEYDFRVESVSHLGDRVEGMAYTDGQLADFLDAIERAIREGSIPRAILLSGGGNDIAGDELALFLDHSDASSRGLNEDVMRGVIDQRVRLAYVCILAKVTHACVELLGRPIPIVLHGYDYPNPDGRGFLWLGPWLEPAFRAKGYGDKEERLKIMEALIDRFNAMLGGLPTLPGFSHVRHVDLRGTLPNRERYKDWWDNELHPTRRGFAAVTAKIVAAL